MRVPVAPVTQFRAGLAALPDASAALPAEPGSPACFSGDKTVRNTHGCRTAVFGIAVLGGGRGDSRFGANTVRWPMLLLTLCGSLRRRSSNRALLEAYQQLAPALFLFDHFAGIAELPHFNPDLDGERAPEPVLAWRRRVATADTLVVSTPEYAHGLPGSLKNALDWLVSDPVFAGKRVAILHLDRGSRWALDSLREILRTMSAQIVGPACVSLQLTSNLVEPGDILARPDLRDALLRSLDALAAAG